MAEWGKTKIPHEYLDPSNFSKDQIASPVRFSRVWCSNVEYESDYDDEEE